MRLANTGKDAISQGLGDDTTAFSIEMNAHMVNLLSDKLYTDKIAAGPREIIQNAWDAHVLVGYTDKPFDIHPPSTLEPYFYCRDYGPGLSDEQAKILFTTYGASLKQKSNAFAGGFGIGSKAPFTYTDQYTTVSWHKGVKRTYLCYKDKGIPNFTLVSEVASIEPSGVQVQFAVKNQDIQAFHNRIRDIIRFLPTKPNMIGHFSHEDPLQYTLLGKGWGMTSVGGYDFNVRVVVGVLSYSVNIASVTDVGYNFPHGYLDMFFQVGEIDIAASRETVEYTPRTKAKIKQKFEDFCNVLCETHINKLNSIDDYYEAHNYLHNQLPVYLRNNPAVLVAFASKHGAVTSSIGIRTQDGTKVAKVGYSVRRMVDWCTVTHFNAYQVRRAPQIVVLDVKSRYKQRLEQYFLEEASEPKRFVFLLDHPTQSDLEHVQKTLHTNTPPVYLSNIKLPKIVGSGVARTPKHILTGATTLVYNKVYDHCDTAEEDVDLNNGGVYHSDTGYKLNYLLRRAKNIVIHAARCGANVPTCVVVPHFRSKKLQAHPKWQTLQEWAEQYTDNTAAKYVEALNHEEENSLGAGHLKYHLKKIVPLLDPNSKLVELFNSVSTMTDEQEALIRYYSNLCLTVDRTVPTTNTTTETLGDKITKLYPMLGLLADVYTDKFNPVVVDYIEQQDKLMKQEKKNG